MTRSQEAAWVAAVVVFAVTVAGLALLDLPSGARQLNAFSISIYSVVVATVGVLLRYWVHENITEDGHWKGASFRRRK
ncbi:MAG: hypothetical protein LC632_02295 [Xanthomonadaceae bacterium]|nr:hypothetical protein [Xanthomonadaceae bacterium]